MVHRILALENTILVEDMNFRALQKLAKETKVNAKDDVKETDRVRCIAIATYPTFKAKQDSLIQALIMDRERYPVSFGI
ncbi:MAG: hypothetical protein ACRCWQ_05475 [Bacilli bacterium]